MSQDISGVYNLGPQGLYLPPWAIGLVLAGIAGATALGVEARFRLGAQDRALAELRAEVSASLSEIRNDAKSERERSRAEEASVTREITSIRVTLAAICAATKARCP